ncbi:hypothetical protein [Oceanobacillus kapialis]|uniref:hypothetical protein n=1 Tax=Oceanobacillus kapialis TaxID=481353 RepID=UPI00384BC61B
MADQDITATAPAVEKSDVITEAAVAADADAMLTVDHIITGEKDVTLVVNRFK